MRHAAVIGISAAVAATVRAAQNERTFAVLRFYGDGPMMEGRVDPIVSPGQASSHVHTIQGSSNFGTSATGQDLMDSNCSSALVEGDNSAYWVPKLYFHDRSTGMLEDVSMYYMNVYYFFEPTDDEVVAFPVGLQMVSGNATARTCPNFGGADQLDAGSPAGIQPLQWTCPRSGYSPASWPSSSASDGSKAGIQDPNNQGSGQGFPFENCDGEYSPLRQDLHFPSCYDPSKGLTDYQDNMVFPTTVYDGYVAKQNCPKGFKHVPHLFYETYWNTIDFKDRWDPGQGEQPFVLSNGDLSGCSGHGDFMAAWDTAVLQNIIDNCDAGDPGMIYCPGVTVRDQGTSCSVASPIDEAIRGNLTSLPGSNPLRGWGMSEGGSSPSGPATSAAASVSSSSSSSASPAPGSPYASSSSSSLSSSSSSSSAAPQQAASPSEGGGGGISPPSSSPSPSSAAAAALAAAHTTTTTTTTTAAAAAVPTDEDEDVAATAAAPGATVTTLPDGRVVTTTVVDWVTVTRWVAEAVPAATQTVQAARKNAHGHAHAHAHVFKHRSGHHRRW